jgi:hypothetical protein
LGAKIENKDLFRHGAAKVKNARSFLTFRLKLVTLASSPASQYIHQNQFTMKKLFLFLSISVLSLSSCQFWGGERVRGNGNVVTETRDVSGFSAIRVSSAIDLYVTQDSNYSIRVEADENLQPLLEVYRDGDALEIHPQDGLNLDATGSIKVYVSAPVIRMLGASGACSVITENTIRGEGIKVDMSGASDGDLDLNMTEVDMQLSGACNIVLRGSTDMLRIDGSGSSHVKGYDMQAVKADIRLSGASSAYSSVSEILDADLSGASDVRYKGQPKVNSKTSGASDVHAAE